jgi:histidinol-phosphate/aromatic aminotransferase/cobyric acid decarboxylase-like protein
VIPPPGPHGGDGARLARALGVDPAAVLDLSASLNPMAADPGQVVSKHVDAVSRYPEPAEATAAMAAALGCDVERVLLTNGGAEAISLVATELGGWVEEPEFSLHPRDVAGRGPRWRSDPHSPSGRLAAPDEQAGVWDEAFFPLAAGRWTAGRVGAVVVGSLTKVFACPGLRIGYVLAPEGDLVARLRRRQPAWSLNALAAAALPAMLDTADLPGWARGVALLRERLVRLLQDHGLHPGASDANWVLVRAPGLRSRLASQGVLVRDCASFGLPDRVRIAVPGPDGLARLATALDRAQQS